MGATEIHLALERVYHTQCSLLLKKSRSVTEMTDWRKECDPSTISWKCKVCCSPQHGKFRKLCAQLIPSATRVCQFSSCSALGMWQVLPSERTVEDTWPLLGQGGAGWRISPMILLCLFLFPVIKAATYFTGAATKWRHLCHFEKPRKAM